MSWKWVNLQNVGRASAQSVAYNLEFKQKPAAVETQFQKNKVPAIQGQNIQIQTFAN